MSEKAKKVPLESAPFGKRLLPAMGRITFSGKPAIRWDLTLEPESKSRDPFPGKPNRKSVRSSRLRLPPSPPVPMWLPAK